MNNKIMRRLYFILRIRTAIQTSVTKCDKIIIAPVFWFGVCIVIILLFTGVYTKNANSFYQPNLEYDIQYQGLESKIKEEFKSVLLDSMNKISDGEYINIDDGRYILDKNNINVYEYNSEDTSFNISVEILDTNKYDYNSTEAFMLYDMQYKCYLTGTRFFLEDNTVLQTCTVEQLSKVYDAIKNEKTNELIDISQAFGSNDWAFPVKITDNLDKNIRSIIYANNGLGTYVDNNVCRMLYLSIVTITTLGFGDIVPITDLARILIGLESFCGVVISGFFVNAVFHKATNKQK